jgi:hypothetical protein
VCGRGAVRSKGVAHTLLEEIAEVVIVKVRKLSRGFAVGNAK